MGTYKSLPPIAAKFFDRVSLANNILGATGIAGFRDTTEPLEKMTTRPFGRIHFQYALDIREAQGVITDECISAASMSLFQCVARSGNTELSITTTDAKNALSLLYFGTQRPPDLKDPAWQKAVAETLRKIEAHLCSMS